MSSPEDAKIKVALVDDQALLRAGFRMVIDSQPDLSVVAEASNGVEAVSLLSKAVADVVLMDIRMPEMDGLTATAKLIANWQRLSPVPCSKVVVLTTFDLDEYALEAIKVGASGFLLKDAPPEEMLQAIRTVHRGDAVIAASTTKRLMHHFVDTGKLAAAPGNERVFDQLTDREREVLILMARGLSNTEIAKELFVAEATVKTHVGRVLAKLGSRDRVQAVVIAYENGLVVPGDQ